VVDRERAEGVGHDSDAVDDDAGTGDGTAVERLLHQTGDPAVAEFALAFAFTLTFAFTFTLTLTLTLTLTFALTLTFTFALTLTLTFTLAFTLTLTLTFTFTFTFTFTLTLTARRIVGGGVAGDNEQRRAQGEWQRANQHDGTPWGAV